MKQASKDKLIQCLKTNLKLWRRYRIFTKYYSVDLRNSDLSYTNLSNSDLSNADLRYSDLSYANLSNADVSAADIDYTSIPFHCGSIDMRCDERIIRQSLYHVARYEYIGDDDDIKELLSSPLYKKVANKFHRVEECGKL